MDLATGYVPLALGMGLLESTDTSAEENLTTELVNAGFTAPQAAAIIHAAQTYSNATARTSADTPPQTKETGLDRLITKLAGSFVPLAVLAAATVAVVAFALLTSS